MDTRYHMSTREIAKVLGLSRATVDRIEARALRKVRAALEKRGITALDLEHEQGSHPLADLRGER